MTNWKRLRVIEGEYTHSEQLLAIAEALRRIPEPAESLREQAATWLERLARNEKALALVTSTGPGRKRTMTSSYIALDYLVQKELLGKALAAEVNVAEAWAVPRKTVKDAWTDSQVFARQKLDKLTEGRVGATRGMKRGVWTRRTLLEDISADLREQHAKQGRGK